VAGRTRAPPTPPWGIEIRRISDLLRTYATWSLAAGV